MLSGVRESVHWEQMGSSFDFYYSPGYASRSVIYNLVWEILMNKKQNLGDSLVHVHENLDTPFSKVVTLRNKNQFLYDINNMLSQLNPLKKS